MSEFRVIYIDPYNHKRAFGIVANGVELLICNDLTAPDPQWIKPDLNDVPMWQDRIDAMALVAREERIREARASVALDADTQHCTHTTDGTLCDACMGRTE